jgi:hypothetical protein
MRTIPTRRGLLSVLIGSLAAAARAAERKWTALCDGKTLAGWKAEGKAGWSVEDGAIVGRQGPGGTAGDLFTDKRWANFELEAEWKMKWPGNSGIWFRRTGPRTGYQADFLDQQSHPGVLSGSLYCMGKAFIAENRDASSVNKDGWNRLRIQAEGDLITVEQNGKRVVQVRDATFSAAGSIGIQIHAGAAFTGMEVRVRAIRLRPLGQEPA